MKYYLLFIFSLVSSPLLQKFWYRVYLLGLAGMGYGYGVNNQGHAKKIAYEKLGYKKSNETFILFDVGANIGQTIDESIKFGYKNIMIYSFEPQKHNFEILEKKYKKNLNISLHKIGFGSKKEILNIYKEIQGDTSASVYHSNTSDLISEKIQIDTIDNFCSENNIEKISYLKMDIEGSEFSALQGAKNTIQSGKIEAIEFEFLWQNIKSRVFLKDFFDLLSNDYTFYRILPHCIYEIKEYSHLLEIYCLSNFVCIKKG